MTDLEIREILTEIARTELGLDGPLPSGELAEHLDSVQRLTLVVGIEDRFLICFEPEEEEDARTLGEVIRIIQVKTKDTPVGPG